MTLEVSKNGRYKRLFSYVFTIRDFLRIGED